MCVSVLVKLIKPRNNVGGRLCENYTYWLTRRTQSKNNNRRQTVRQNTRAHPRSCSRHDMPCFKSSNVNYTHRENHQQRRTVFQNRLFSYKIRHCFLLHIKFYFIGPLKWIWTQTILCSMMSLNKILQGHSESLNEVPVWSENYSACR